MCFLSIAGKIDIMLPNAAAFVFGQIEEVRLASITSYCRRVEQSNSLFWLAFIQVTSEDWDRVLGTNVKGLDCVF